MRRTGSRCPGAAGSLLAKGPISEEERPGCHLLSLRLLRSGEGANLRLCRLFVCPVLCWDRGARSLGSRSGLSHWSEGSFQRQRTFFFNCLMLYDRVFREMPPAAEGKMREMTRAEPSSIRCLTVTTLSSTPEERVGLPQGPVTREGQGARQEDQRPRA